MNENKYTQIGKYLSYLLRHEPKLEMDNNGYVDIEYLIKYHNTNRNEQINFNILEIIVNTDNKQRFGFNNDFTKIRANQGHSVNVKINYNDFYPNTVLYHGTSIDNFDSIIKQGLLKGTRQHVHLSQDIETAHKVGQRHGKPIVFTIDTKKAIKDGIKFKLSDNNVCLVDHVPSKYLSFDRKISCSGIILFRKIDNKTECMLVESKETKYGFPKGKAEKGETIVENAIRETFEETGATINDYRFLPYCYDNSDKLIENSDKGNPSVFYFVAEVINDFKIKYDTDELYSCKWYDIQKAKELVTKVKNRRSIIESAHGVFLSNCSK